mmetsp:Transcript_52560/g.170799  ORF Transcript_52560/g.170799 Transcript_52560/m.170799 type:complete len:122 (+) Transcript_52560:3232-3597(+)
MARGFDEDTSQQGAHRFSTRSLRVWEPCISAVAFDQAGLLGARLSCCDTAELREPSFMAARRCALAGHLLRQLHRVAPRFDSLGINLVFSFFVLYIRTLGCIPSELSHEATLRSSVRPSGF